ARAGGEWPPARFYRDPNSRRARGSFAKRRTYYARRRGDGRANRDQHRRPHDARTVQRCGARKRTRTHAHPSPEQHRRDRSAHERRLFARVAFLLQNTRAPRRPPMMSIFAAQQNFHEIAPPVGYSFVPTWAIFLASFIGLCSIGSL